MVKENNEVGDYSAKDIEILEGLEPVRKRPGMYIGGIDSTALHHLISEIFDNSMDEVMANHADLIKVKLRKDNFIEISDNGRGIPIDSHEKYPDKSVLEIILTTLHSGGKFSNKAYETSGGLHGVGISVVNAVSDQFQVIVMRDGNEYTQSYQKGKATSSLATMPLTTSKKSTGTKVIFHPDPEIFIENNKFNPRKIYNFIRHKAYLNSKLSIKWSVDKELLKEYPEIPVSDKIHFPEGLVDYLEYEVGDNEKIIPNHFSGQINLKENSGKLDWSIAWIENSNKDIISFCNTIPTPMGGTHETAVKNSLIKAIKNYALISNNKQASKLVIDDILKSSQIIFSLLTPNPQFHGQTKTKLVNRDIIRIIENSFTDIVEHYLNQNTTHTNELINYLIEQANERLSNKKIKEVSRKTITNKLKLPGKLTDCMNNNSIDTELFIVEGDSAGGTAKQARDKKTQAILPLKGKILNVANNSREKIINNQELTDLILAIGAGSGKNFNYEKIRYNKIIIMTDADVDGAHIAALLMTFFLYEMPEIIEKGHLYIAIPPLYKIKVLNTQYYAHSEEDKNGIISKIKKKQKNSKIEISRFKGLGEMNTNQLKFTTMDPNSDRILVQVKVDRFSALKYTDNIMGKKAENRLIFIQNQLKENIKIEDILDI